MMDIFKDEKILVTSFTESKALSHCGNFIIFPASIASDKKNMYYILALVTDVDINWKNNISDFISERIYEKLDISNENNGVPIKKLIDKKLISIISYIKLEIFADDDTSYITTLTSNKCSSYCRIYDIYTKNEFINTYITNKFVDEVMTSLSNMVNNSCVFVYPSMKEVDFYKKLGFIDIRLVEEDDPCMIYCPDTYIREIILNYKDRINKLKGMTSKL